MVGFESKGLVGGFFDCCGCGLIVLAVKGGWSFLKDFVDLGIFVWIGWF